MKNFAIKSGALLLALFVLYFCSLAIFHRAARDQAGNKPADVVLFFVEAVNTNNFLLAASFWELESIRNVEVNHEMNFTNFCASRFKCNNYELGVTTRQKGGYFKVPFRGTSGNDKKTYNLYLKRINHKWLLGEDLWLQQNVNSLAPTNTRAVP